jgi:hypothetical protein
VEVAVEVGVAVAGAITVEVKVGIWVLADVGLLGAVDVTIGARLAVGEGS